MYGSRLRQPSADQTRRFLALWGLWSIQMAQGPPFSAFELATYDDRFDMTLASGYDPRSSL
jgi:hypothetical protein